VEGTGHKSDEYAVVWLEIEEEKFISLPDLAEINIVMNRIVDIVWMHSKI
jgi:hypothetical protein